MAATPKLTNSNNVTAVTTVYTCPVATAAIVMGLLCCNDGAADTTLTVEVVDSTGPTTTKICNAEPLPLNSSKNPILNTGRLNLEAGDSIKVTSGGENVDVTVSILELT